MANRIKAYTEADYEEIGRRYGSEDVAREASLALARWERDVSVLAGYGHGRKAFEAFKGLVSQHAQTMRDRPEGLASKRDSVQGRERIVANGWAWVDRAESMLLVLAREDASLANGLKEAVPHDDAALPTGVGALAKLLQAQLSALDPEAGADGLVAQSADLVQALTLGPGTVKGSKEATKEDTREVNLLDGKVAIVIRDLNGAGRKAFRNQEDDVKVKDYKFHVLKHVGASAGPASPPGQAPAS